MSLEADIRARRDGFTLDAAFTAQPGGIVALIGPNGSGKTTLAHALAGLVPIETGHIRLGGRVLDDTNAGVCLPPRSRHVSLMFQDGLLFGTMSVLDNVAFGLRARGRSRADARGVARAWLDRVDMLDHADRRPGQLSGGQSQRVALARALAPEPELLILDEPLSAMDIRARPDARRMLRCVLDEYKGITILITHEPVEALALADTLLILDGGRLVQHGAMRDVCRMPRNPYAASLVGVNMFTGRIKREPDRTLICLDDSPETHGGCLRIARTDMADGAEVFATLHPHAIILSIEKPTSSARNVLHGRVRLIDTERDRVRVTLDSRPSITAEITIEALEQLGLAVGAACWCSFKATEIRVYTR